MTTKKQLSVGASASPLDIYFRDNNTNQFIDPASLSFIISEPAGLDVIVGAGSGLTTGHFVASGTIPTGFALGEGWKITWSATFPGGGSGTFIENFCVQDPNVVGLFGDPSNEVDTIFDRVRLDIGDPDGQIFNDGFLGRMLEKAAARLNRSLGIVEVECSSRFNLILRFTTVRSRPVISINLSTGEITPDTDPYVDILTLQMEYLIVSSELSALKRMNPNLGGVVSSGIQGVSGDGISATNADGVTISKSPTRLTTRADLFKFDVNRLKEELNNAIKDFRWRLTCGVDVSIPRYVFGYGYGSTFYVGPY